MSRARYLLVITFSLFTSIYGMDEQTDYGINEQVTDQFNFYCKKFALISVYDKTDIVELASKLIEKGYEILSTGGTYAYLKEYLSEEETKKVMQISDLTGYPEILDGRVKTLHPQIMGGVLANRSKNTQEIVDFKLPDIRIVVVNLYPFEKVTYGGCSLDTATENVDIGGVTLIRAAAKNYNNVTVITNPNDYKFVMKELDPSLEDRLFLANQAFLKTAAYDSEIGIYFTNVYINKYLIQSTENPKPESHQKLECQVPVLNRYYTPIHSLKYGLNPHQGKKANICMINNKKNPLVILNGNLSYINTLDAMNSYQLVFEAKKLLNLPCAASFKHNSPAGVGLGVELSEELKIAYGVQGLELNQLAIAFIRARNADPKSSFGDFIALSDIVDEQTAGLISKEVSDGIIAPGYTEKALEILKGKKSGNYPIIQIDPNYTNEEEIEIREINGIAITQEPNRAIINKDLLNNVVTNLKDIPQEAVRDLLLAMITLKYTQSNSIVFAVDGQAIGVGAGQQNRVDCVRIAGKKADIWKLRQHPKVMNLKFKKEVKKADRTNATIEFIKGHDINYLLEIDAIPLSKEERRDFLPSQSNICLASDAFFPFEDNIEEAAIHSVKYIAQPGGSIRDNQITDACNKFEIVEAITKLRLFTH